MTQESKHFGLSLVLFAGIAVAIFAIYKGIATQLSGPTADMSPEAVAERIAPVAQLNTGEVAVAQAEPDASTPDAAPAAEAAPETAPAPAESSAPEAGSQDAQAADGRSGEAVYNSACVACHLSGAAGAPKIGDAQAWAPRIAKGMDALMQSALNGLNAMPPRGTCATCSDAELKRAIEYMVGKSQ